MRSVARRDGWAQDECREGVGEPVLELFGRPATLAHEDLEELWTAECVEDVDVVVAAWFGRAGDLALDPQLEQLSLRADRLEDGLPRDARFGGDGVDGGGGVAPRGEQAAGGVDHVAVARCRPRSSTRPVIRPLDNTHTSI